MKKCLLLLVTFLLVASLLGMVMAETVTLRVNEVTHSVFYAPQYLAINLGLFEKHGITVKLTNSQGSDKVMTAVLAGQAEIGLAGPETTLYVYLQGKADYPQVFAQLTKRDGSFLVGREEEETFDWKALAGKHVLPGRKGGMPYMALRYAIVQNGLNPETDLNFDNSISFDAMTGAFLGGVGDYVTIFEPTATILVNEGRGYIVASVGEESGEIPFTAYFASKSYLEKHPDIIQAFVDTIYEAQVWLMTHTAREAAEVLLPSFPDSDIDVLETVVARYQEIDAWCKTPIMTEDSFMRLQDVMEGAGELTERAPFEAIVRNEFAEKAVASTKE